MGALLRAFVKTLAERRHAMVILDAPNSRAAEFREFWQAGQTAGYEVYVLIPLETDAEVRSCLLASPLCSPVTFAEEGQPEFGQQACNTSE